LRSEFDAGFEKRNGIFEIVLGHADASEEEDDVGIFWREFVGANEEFEGVDGAGLFIGDLSEEIENVGGNRA